MNVKCHTREARLREAYYDIDAQQLHSEPPAAIGAKHGCLRWQTRSSAKTLKQRAEGVLNLWLAQDFLYTRRCC